MELELVFWHWLVAAMLLFLLELFAPAAFFVWIGAAAGITSVVVFILPAMSWQYQFIIFAILALVTVIYGRRLFRKDPDETESTLNRRGEQYIGREFILSSAIENGSGRVNVDDGSWRVIGPNLPEGARVKVVDVDGASFRVEAI